MWRPALAALCGLAAGCRSGPAPGTDAQSSAEPSSTTAAQTAPVHTQETVGTGGGASAADAGHGPPAMPSALVDAVVNPMHLPPYNGPTGAVAGTVLVRGPRAPDVPNLDVHACPAALDTYGKLFRSGSPRPDGARPLADAIVVVTGYENYFLPEKSEAQRVTITDQCAYPARTIALTFGQRLEVANDSSLPFAPYIEGGAQLTVMIAAPRRRGEPVKIFPPRADYYRLRDWLQPFVSGDVYVLRQPLHAVSDREGRFRIDGVPEGKLKVAARLGAVRDQAFQEVDVRAGETSKAELVLTYAPRDGGARR